MSDITSIQYEQALLADFEAMLAPEHDDATNDVLDLLPLTGSYDRDLVSMVSEQAPAPAAPAQELTLNGQPWSEYKQLLLDAYVFSHFEGRSMEEDLTGLLYVEYALKQAEIEHVEWLERPARETQDAPDYARAMMLLTVEVEESTVSPSHAHIFDDLRAMIQDKRTRAVIYGGFFGNRTLMAAIVASGYDAAFSKAKSFYEKFGYYLICCAQRFFMDYGFSERYYEELKKIVLEKIAVWAHLVMGWLIPYKTKKARLNHEAKLQGRERDAYFTCKAALRDLAKSVSTIPSKWYD